jgi:hypothetical protein
MENIDGRMAPIESDKQHCGKMCREGGDNDIVQRNLKVQP